MDELVQKKLSRSKWDVTPLLSHWSYVSFAPAEYQTACLYSVFFCLLSSLYVYLQYVYKWLQAISQTHFEVILSCLLPHPVEYARVGGYWDTLASRTSQIKEGLNRLFCLIPYDIVTFEVRRLALVL